MKFLQIGLGSMGKRRIRNLFALNETDITGFDLREDRRREASDKYGIKVLTQLQPTELKKFDALIISVSPDVHIYYMNLAYDNRIPCFVEASVLDDGMSKLISDLKNYPVLIAPSCTMRFHPSIKLIQSILSENRIGKISNFHYHSGNYLPDWHPWESIQDFYVSKPETGGAREIVSFELTWMNWVFGKLVDLKGYYDKTISLDAPIDDTYVASLKYESGILGTMIVDVVSRNYVRQLLINGESGQISWNCDEHLVKLYNAHEKRWIMYYEPTGHAAEGYNVNIKEEMYIEEISCFLSALKGEHKFPNTLEDDYKILQYLYQLEKSDLK